MEFVKINLEVWKSIFGSLTPGSLGAYLFVLIFYKTLLPISEYFILIFLVLLHVIFLLFIPRIIIERFLIRPHILTSFLVEKWKGLLTNKLEVNNSKDDALEKILSFSFSEKAKSELTSLFSKIDNPRKGEILENEKDGGATSTNEPENREKSLGIKSIKNKEIVMETIIRLLTIAIIYTIFSVAVFLSPNLPLESANSELILSIPSNYEVILGGFLAILISLLGFTLCIEREKLFALYRAEISWIGNENQKLSSKIEEQQKFFLVDDKLIMKK